VTTAVKLNNPSSILWSVVSYITSQLLCCHLSSTRETIWMQWWRHEHERDCLGWRIAVGFSYAWRCWCRPAPEDIEGESKLFSTACDATALLAVWWGSAPRNMNLLFPFLFPYIIIEGSAVGIATGYGLDDRGVGVWVPVWSRILFSLRRPGRLWRPPNLLSSGYRGLFLRGKASGARSWPLTSS
jgi:hypothetical protein